MDRNEKKILNDILICVTSIESYIGEKRVFEEYDSNFILQDAVERNLITVGEAMNLLLKLNPSVAITNTRKNYWCQEQVNAWV